MNVKFALTPKAQAEGLPLPARAHDTDAGFDLRLFGGSTDDIFATLDGREVIVLRTGVCVSIPPGYCGILRERSSWAKKGLLITGGVIDSGYTGEILVTCSGFHFARKYVSDAEEKYPRFAQLLIVPIWQGDVEYVEILDETERGAKGFGSTGNS